MPPLSVFGLLVPSVVPPLDNFGPSASSALDSNSYGFSKIGSQLYPLDQPGARFTEPASLNELKRTPKGAQVRRRAAQHAISLGLSSTGTFRGSLRSTVHWGSLVANPFLHPLVKDTDNELRAKLLKEGFRLPPIPALGERYNLRSGRQLEEEL